MRPLKEKGQGRKAGNQASYTHKSPAVVGAGFAVWAAMPVAMPAWLVHPARLYGASGFVLVPVHVGVCCAGGCRLGVAGCCVLCFLFWACVPQLTVCMLCSSYLCSGFFGANPDAYSALCLVLHCVLHRQGR